jgi:hypothetical protein
MRRVPLGGGPGQPSLAARSPGGVCSLDQRSRLVPVSSTAASLPQTVLKTGGQIDKVVAGADHRRPGALPQRGRGNARLTVWVG